MSDDRTKTIADFNDVVNMTTGQIEKWLRTNESKEVGQKVTDGSESTGHASGRHIVTLLQKKRADYDAADLHQLGRVISYVHRHLAQKPSGDIEHSHWRYSLMNWGHDPLKDK